MNFPEKLTHEVARVTRLQVRYEGMRGLPQVNVEPVLALIRASLSRAFVAISEGDIAAQALALADLEGYRE
ncbi:hypothetical protein RA307_31765 [Xanthobacteraceae bacterium Astr-EGSB]|uniref:hypothetical protein n=1 Tax=Astrobacterium formosum TaxID=3069710 RepID=UPI0027AE9422|nr:hypothetical protein [Xanthobacteraceae bacterium Astr-EGSB]